MYRPEKEHHISHTKQAVFREGECLHTNKQKLVRLGSQIRKLQISAVQMCGCIYVGLGYYLYIKGSQSWHNLLELKTSIDKPLPVYWALNIIVNLSRMVRVNWWEKVKLHTKTRSFKSFPAEISKNLNKKKLICWKKHLQVDSESWKLLLFGGLRM